MFTISSKTNYGIAALTELALNYGEGVVQIKEISHRRNIPQNYLEQIFNRLTKQGIIRSVRGNKGGYMLAKTPADISLLNIIESLEGDIESIRQCDVEAVQELFNKIESRTRELLDVSLEEVMLNQQKIDNQILFNI